MNGLHLGKAKSELPQLPGVFAGHHQDAVGCEAGVDGGA